jgi:hypothetical protein
MDLGYIVEVGSVAGIRILCQTVSTTVYRIFKTDNEVIPSENQCTKTDHTIDM